MYEYFTFVYTVRVVLTFKFTWINGSIVQLQPLLHKSISDLFEFLEEEHPLAVVRYVERACVPHLRTRTRAVAQETWLHESD